MLRMPRRWPALEKSGVGVVGFGQGDGDGASGQGGVGAGLEPCCVLPFIQLLGHLTDAIEPLADGRLGGLRVTFFGTGSVLDRSPSDVVQTFVSPAAR